MEIPVPTVKNQRFSGNEQHILVTVFMVTVQRWSANAAQLLQLERNPVGLYANLG